MDVKEIIKKVEAKLGDEKFKKELMSNPAKALEKLLGVNLPDDQVNAVINAVKAKLGAENVEGIVKGAEEALGGILGKDALGGIFGKK